MSADEPIGLAIIRDYGELHAALRARIDSLGISMETFDDLCGFWPGYSSHVLGPKPQGNMRALGKMSLGAALGALGLKLLLLEDRDALAKVRERLIESDKAQTRKKNARPARIVARENTWVKLGRAGANASNALRTAKQRARLARKAARARWSRQPHS